MKIVEQMRWIVWLPLAVILFPILAMKVPSIICTRMRKVQLLSAIGIIYWLLLGTITCLTVDFAYAVVVFVVGFSFGDWLLPGPFAYFFCPRHRRAIYLTIMAQEEAGEIQPIYCFVRVIGADTGGCIVEVPFSANCRPTPCCYFRVSDQSHTVEELTFDYVHEKWGVRQMY